MKNIKQNINFIIMIYILLLTKHTMGSEQIEDAKRARYKKFCCQAKMLTLRSTTTADDVLSFVNNYPEAIASQDHCPAVIFEGQSLFHLLINRRMLSVTYEVMKQCPTQDLSHQICDSNLPARKKKYANSTPFFALCMQSYIKDPEKQSLQYLIAQLALQRNPNLTKLARQDGITPMLAAACNNDSKLMNLIAEFNPDAINDIAKSGHCVVLSICSKMITSDTLKCLHDILDKNPQLATNKLALKLIRNGKTAAFIQLLKKNPQIKMTDQDIQKSWEILLTNTKVNTQYKHNLYNYLKYKFPNIALTSVHYSELQKGNYQTDKILLQDWDNTQNFLLCADYDDTDPQYTDNMQQPDTSANQGPTYLQLWYNKYHKASRSTAPEPTVAHELSNCLVNEQQEFLPASRLNAPHTQNSTHTMSQPKEISWLHSALSQPSAKKE